jgi:ankyrin repeat protein
LADQADPFDLSTHTNQPIQAKKISLNTTPTSTLYRSQKVKRLARCMLHFQRDQPDFVEYLLEVGADPNAQDPQGLTPLMVHTPDMPQCGQISAELAYHGHECYQSI